MVPDGAFDVPCRGATFRVAITEAYVDLFVGQVTDSRRTTGYNGPASNPRVDILGQAVLKGVAVMSRKCKTVLKIESTCSTDAISALVSREARANAGRLYLMALCAAHLPVVNQVILTYRWLTADPGVMMVSLWDVPIWFVRTPDDAFRVALIPAAEWDSKPTFTDFGDRDNPKAKRTAFQFTDIPSLANAASKQIEPSEMALLDARSLLQRGDYSGAIRRIVTALEVLLERQLRMQLSQHHAPAEVKARLEASQNDFLGRWRQYEKLSGRSQSQSAMDTLKKIRTMRHQIVHEGRIISHDERGLANWAVDIGRFTYNWLEDDPQRQKDREQHLTQKAIGGNPWLFFGAEIGPMGVRVKPQ
jgi:hypothetical protein